MGPVLRWWMPSSTAHRDPRGGWAGWFSGCCHSLKDKPRKGGKSVKSYLRTFICAFSLSATFSPTPPPPPTQLPPSGLCTNVASSGRPSLTPSHIKLHLLHTVPSTSHHLTHWLDTIYFAYACVSSIRKLESDKSHNPSTWISLTHSRH